MPNIFPANGAFKFSPEFDNISRYSGIYLRYYIDMAVNLKDTSMPEAIDGIDIKMLRAAKGRTNFKRRTRASG
jgi:hypothetical protein